MPGPEQNGDIPVLTKLAAAPAFPKGSVAMTMRDELGVVFEDEAFAELYPGLGQPAERPAQLAPVTVMQYMENLTDRQAADAVRGRIDWKYALGLELSDAGFDHSVLCEFRQRLIAGAGEMILLDRLLERWEEKAVLKGKEKQRTDSTHVLAAIRTLNLMELVGETMRLVLNELAQVAPAWLKSQVEGEWAERYGRRFERSRMPKTDEKRQALAERIGSDGYQLLQPLFTGPAPVEVKTWPRVEIRHQIWLQHSYVDDTGVHWRSKKTWGQLPVNRMICSPHDLDARYSVKRSTNWMGCQVQLTETCEPDAPRVMTEVATTAATTQDVHGTGAIQNNLIERDLQPDTHLVDGGYVEADLLVESQEHKIDLLGPAPGHQSWQDRVERGLDHSQFKINWERKQAVCPARKTSIRWNERQTRRQSDSVVIAFAQANCQPCPLRSRCTRVKSEGRVLTVYPQKQYEAQQQVRQRQTTSTYKKLYGLRAGIEGTISQGVRVMGMRPSRYRGLARTHMQHVATVAAINICRAVEWLNGERPKPTPVSPCVALVAPT